MARPLRIEYPGAVYHVTAWGNARAEIFRDDGDRRGFLALLAEIMARRGWTCHAWCLMDNHYHLMLETASADLGRGMRQLNGVYTQRFNQAHRRVGHVFQGRYKAILVEREAHLLELCRYVVLNPVRAGMAARTEDWRWSSYRRTAGLPGARDIGADPAAPGWVLQQFGAEVPAARAAYRRFVRDGIAAADSPWEALRGGIVLGSDAFRERLARLAKGGHSPETPRRQRRLTRPALASLQAAHAERGAWMAEAHDTHGYTLAEIAGAAGLHYSSVSRIIAGWREANRAK